MLSHGVAPAGANQGLQGHFSPHGEDGILYALEVQDLNLEDTELVALSACDTGVDTLDYSKAGMAWCGHFASPVPQWVDVAVAAR